MQNIYLAPAQASKLAAAIRNLTYYAMEHENVILQPKEGFLLIGLCKDDETGMIRDWRTIEYE